MSATVSPTEQEVVQVIRRVQNTQGLQTGIPKIHEYIKETQPTWILSVKRLRDIRRKHNLVPSDTNNDTPSANLLVSAGAGPMKKLRLEYMLARDGPTVEFFQDIPAEYCTPNAPRETTSKFITDLMEIADVEALKAWNSTCLFCQKLRAKALFTVPAATLTAEKPIVLVTAIPLCSMSSACARQAYALVQSAMLDPNGPMQEEGASVYQMP
ncbi:hypothetical protein HWV62_36444 [Athelia sp. TMB]|nr:hypothetical protein HWV62_36444 [Athelia sp. TMB]